MHGERVYSTYIMASRSRTLYIGMTGNLRQRVFEHKQKRGSDFTAKYRCSRLVWYENFHYVRNSIAMEKKLKGWLRARKIALIEEVNPSWEDLSEGWYSEEQLRIDEGEADPSLRR